MSEVAGPAAATRAPTAERPPRRAEGIVLIGEMTGSGYREPPALVRRADGQTVQLTPVLYATLAAIDGRRDLRELAQDVTAATGRTVTEIEQEGPSASEVREVLNYVRTQLRKQTSTHTMKKVANG